MDKEPSLGRIWLTAAAGALATFWLTRRQPFLGVLSALLFGWTALVAVSEWHDPLVGPAMLQEAGASYGVQAHAALSFVVLALIVGVVSWYRERRAVTMADEHQPGV